MESQFISACLSNDLVQARKLFESIMLERTTDLIGERKVEIARSFLIEGEEPKDEDESDEKDKKESDDADEGDDEDEDD
ncbi:hypothetical protein SEA1_gp0164 [Salmonella phage SEA1]|nr:hypothetical protein SEA1_gp0164 [Salmonella phage SEA1]